MTHLDLFSGIGGFALAADWTWPGLEHVFCEIDPFCQAVLKKHWPQSKIYGDIRTLTADTRSSQQRGLSSSEREKVSETWHGSEGIDLLTGGFPCQPFSQAGRRRGTEDDRYLWPEMLRVIREFHPRWVIGENVGGLVTWNGGMVLEQVCADLEREGYSVQPFVIPAVAVNAPHRRDRVWIVAHADDTKGKRRLHGHADNKWSSERKEHLSLDTNSDAADTNIARFPQSVEAGQQENAETLEAGPHNRAIRHDTRIAPDSGDPRLQGRKRSKSARYGGQHHRNGRHERPDWTEDWTKVAAKLCTLDDGLPRGLVQPRGWRNAALKAAGNAIVPQVAAEIMRAIRASDATPDRQAA